MAKLPRRHLVPHILGDDPGARHTLLYRLRHSPLLDVLARAMDRTRAQQAKHPTLARATQLQWMGRLRGAWQSATRSYGRGLLFIPQKQQGFTEPMVEFGGFEFCYDVYPAMAAERDLRHKRVLITGSGGLGDHVIFAQLAQSLRQRHNTVVDVAHHGTLADDDLMASLYGPCRVLRLPMPYQEFRQYDYVLPVGMYAVLYGETLDAYFRRAFNVPFEAHGFARDEEVESKVLTRLEHRHEVDPRKRPTIFVQLKSRPLKTYEHMEALVEALVARGHPVVLIGGPRESALGDRVGKLANLCGLPVWDTLQALRHAALVVTPDSVFMHVAGALGVPGLALFGPTSAYWASPYPKTTVVCYQATCRWQPCWVPNQIMPPCGSSGSPPCLEQMPVDYLVRLIEQKLAGRLSDGLVEIPRIPKLQIVTDALERDYNR